MSLHVVKGSSEYVLRSAPLSWKSSEEMAVTWQLAWADKTAATTLAPRQPATIGNVHCYTVPYLRRTECNLDQPRFMLGLKKKRRENT